jgi:Uma2 family endonuclease
MAAMTSNALTPRDEGSQKSIDNRVMMRGLDWDGYQTLLDLRGERPQPRMAYLDGVVELMTTGWDHERIKMRIGALLEAYMCELDVPFGSYGQWTLKREKAKAGAEADQCYQIGPDQTERFPDLAIEVVWTSGGIDKLEIYRRLGIGEVWFWEDGRINVYVLTNSGYELHAGSQCVPQVDLDLIGRFVEVPLQNEAIKQLREAIAKR